MFELPAYTKRRLVRAWGLLSCLWIAGVVVLVSSDLMQTYEPVEWVHIEVEAESAEDKEITRLFFSGIHGSPLRASYPSRQFDEGSQDFPKLLRKASENFPSFDGLPDAALLYHIETLVAEEMPSINSERERQRRGVVLEGLMVALLLPASMLVIGLLGIRLRRRFSTETLPPYTKKVIAVAITWILASMAWSVIKEDGDIGDVLNGGYPLIFILPPAVFVVAASLWAWARREPSSN